jgi:hypothetical protein
VISLFMALLSSRGIDTQSLQARGEQRRSIYFNNDRDIPISRTASLLNSFVKRLCLFPLIAPSSIFHRGWLSTFAGQVHYTCINTQCI